MKSRSKKYKEAEVKLEDREYALAEALEMLKSFPKTKFDESIDIALTLGIDPKKSDQMVRGSALLPNGTGKTTRVAVFCKGDQVDKAKEAGADFVGAEDLVEKVKGGWLDFDVAISTPEMMRELGKVGRVLGPRGLMPNPKTGTVTQDVEKVVKEAKAGRVSFKCDKTGVVHTFCGKSSFEVKALQENVRKIVDEIKKLKPAAVKGTYIKSIHLSKTMSPSVRLSLSEMGE